mgnify:FL=1
MRLGSLLIKIELTDPITPKTIEMMIDGTNTAIIRGVTIPYHNDMVYGNIYWTSASVLVVQLA